MLGKFQLEGIPPAPRGVPQIEVTFDVDSNGILNVSACDKASGKSEKITIKNDKGRLSQEDIDRMVDDSEKYKEQDDLMKRRVDAKNQLENMCYQMKSSLEQDEVKTKLTQDEVKQIQDKVDETLSKIDTTENASTEEYESWTQEFTQATSPIIQKLYSQNADMSGGGMQNEPEKSSGGPEIEEVD